MELETPLQWDTLYDIDGPLIVKFEASRGSQLVKYTFYSQV